MEPSVLIQAATDALVEYSEFIQDLPNSAFKKAHESAHLMLGAMMTYAPTNEGSDYVATAINKCTSNDELRQLGIMYRDDLILPFKAKGGKTPAISSHASNNEMFERLTISALLESAKREGPKLRYAVLKRNNSRCVVTGVYDPNRFKGPDPPRGSETVFAGFVEAAHIIPFCLLSNTDTAWRNDKLSAVWQIIRAFSGVDFGELNGQEINKLENMMTLSLDAHRFFGDLSLWFEPVKEKDHSYYVRKAFPFVLGRVASDEIIQFTSTSPDLPLPDPRYIALHAAFAKIAHASGAAAYIDALRDEWEETTVLSGDGSSAEMFHQALHLAKILAH